MKWTNKCTDTVSSAELKYGKKQRLPKSTCCYRARNFFPTVQALIGHFEVTWHLTMKPFPAKISERVTLQNLWRQRCKSELLAAKVDRRTPLQRGRMNFRLQNLQLYNKSLFKDWSLGTSSPKEQSLSVWYETKKKKVACSSAEGHDVNFFLAL